MTKMTLEEWKEEGERRFGSDVEKWRVKCPMCGKITEVSEFKAAGAESPDCAFVECIGRYTGQGSPSESKGFGCNWAAYGLFGIPSDEKYVVVFPDGHETSVFPFADKDKGESDT